MKLVLQLLAIAVGGSVLGLGLNAASPRPVPLAVAVYPASASGTAVCGAHGEQAPVKGFARMPLKEAVSACGACTAGFVDARGAAAFAQGHIPQAVHLPPIGHEDEKVAIQKLHGFSTIVVYDDGLSCNLASGVAERLVAAGFTDVRLLDGAWDQWTDAGGPAESGACEACGHGHEASR